MDLTKLNMILARAGERRFFSGVSRAEFGYNLDESLLIVEKIGRMRLPSFSIDDENRFCYENMIRWCHADEDMRCIDSNGKIVPGDVKRGIFIAGGTGTGKSWCLDIMTSYSYAIGVRVIIGELSRLLSWQNIRTDSICDEYTSSGIASMYKTMPIVGFQDLGSEPVESCYMGNRGNVMRNIIEARGDKADQMTLISSNLPMYSRQLLTRYGDRVQSRLNQMCNYLEIRGKDRRK